MPQTIYDAVIIGGGPGGSSAAAFLAKSGKRVLLLEKEHFPRFHIGESLLPYNRGLFEEIGVLPKLEAAGFPLKYGAQFHIGSGQKALKLKFRNGRFTRLTTAFQVERAVFDDILLKHSQSLGAEVREGWTVNGFSARKGSVEVTARDERGGSESFTAKFLIDASGRGNFTGNTEGLRIIHEGLRKMALFGHFENVAVDEGYEGTDTVIVRLENKWFWLIPITSTKVSVGCVLDRDELSNSKLSPSAHFEKTWRGSAVMQARMANARLIGCIQTTSDFSYYNRRLTGPRLLRVGDAAGFMDPIFSAGVYLAMYSGKLAANVVLQALAEGSNGGTLLARYEKKVFRAMRLYWRMVEGFYTTPFLELFMEPRPKFDLPDAITAILAGEVDGGWPMAWRREFFFMLARIQSKYPLVPRISFQSTRPVGGGAEKP